MLDTLSLLNFQKLAAYPILISRHNVLLLQIQYANTKVFLYSQPQMRRQDWVQD